MINFTVGPVQMPEEIKKIGGEDIPYFRTEEFSKIILENEKILCELVGAVDNERVIFLTSSGTGAMEASVINLFNKNDKVLIINGGNFGQRFVEICNEYEIPNINLQLDYGTKLTRTKLEDYYEKGVTALIINMHETSTNVLYDISMVGEFCKEKNLYFIVDAISSFIADEINFTKMKIDGMILASQKALALPPGLSMIILSKKAIEKIYKNKIKSYYFNLKRALIDGERGQTPYTPAVSIILQLNKRLKDLKEKGIKQERKEIENLANDFRKKIKELPFKLFNENMSNAETAILPINASAYKIFEILKDEYQIWVCPNSGVLKDKIFRVGHIGKLTLEDNEKLILALKDMEERGLL